MLLKGGNEASGYRFRVVTWQPETGVPQSSESTGQTLERAVLSALVKVLPLGATLNVVSEPVGASVAVDGEKVGVTPLTTQVPPGDHTVRLDLKLHTPVEEQVNIIARGTFSIRRTLERVPARITLAAKPSGTSIEVDGKAIGKDAVDQGIQPGAHVIRFTSPGYVPFEAHVDIKPGDTYAQKRTLDPTGWQRFKMALSVAQEDVYARKSYFQVAYEQPTFFRRDLGMRYWYGDQATTAGFDSGANTLPLSLPKTGAGLSGISAEYGTTGRHFTLMVAGFQYARSPTAWTWTLKGAPPVEHVEDGPKGQSFDGPLDMYTLRFFQPGVRFALWRLEFYARVGLELRALHTVDSRPDVSDVQGYKKGLWEGSLDAAGQAGVHVFVVEGLFVDFAWRYNLSLLAAKGGDQKVNLNGFRMGLGYAY